MITKVLTATVIGIETHLVTIEVIIKQDATKRHAFHIVGMGDKAIQESKKRIASALQHSNIDISEMQISVNLAPAHLRKIGSNFDFPIAVAIMHYLKKIQVSESFLRETVLVGELSFDGIIRSITGVVTIALDAHKLGIKRLIVPLQNYAEGVQIKSVTIVGIQSINEFKYYVDETGWEQKKVKQRTAPPMVYNDFKYIKGQKQAKRMMQIAAAGNHNCILVGPPGSGKTMLAQALPGIMPPLTAHQCMETTRVHSAHHDFATHLIKQRPFRNPHHGISQAGMTGGGSPLMPGEISLAHNGVLFLDELTEFKRSVVEALRQPLEDQKITLSRVHSTLTLPCSFLLIAALNPCPCGNLGDRKRNCTCSPLSIYSYLKKISGPFLDRIDLQMFIQSLPLQELQDEDAGWDSATLLDGVKKARAIQTKRYASAEKYNGQLNVADLKTYCALNAASQELLDFCFEKFQMSMRSYHKIIKVSRTLADLEGEKHILEKHLKEALMYRGIEQKLILLKNKI